MRRTIALLFSAVLAASVLAGMGCGGGGPKSYPPEQVTEKFLQAMMDEDADAAYDLLSEESKTAVTDKEQLVMGGSQGIEGYEVGAVTISGETARVPVTLRITGMETGLDFEVFLRDENGSWKVSLPDTQTEMDRAIEELKRRFQPPQ